MLNTPPHLEARGPRGFVSIFHGTSSSVARRRLRASDLSFWQSMPSFDIGRPGLHLQSGASVVLGGVGELPGSRCTDFNPRARGGRDRTESSLPPSRSISIHAPRVGRDACSSSAMMMLALFQSTRPVWGATQARIDFIKSHNYFNPRAPCGARPWPPHFPASVPHFNPRAPCGARLGRPAG